MEANSGGFRGLILSSYPNGEMREGYLKLNGELEDIYCGDCKKYVMESFKALLCSGVLGDCLGGLPSHPSDWSSSEVKPSLLLWWAWKRQILIFCMSSMEVIFTLSRVTLIPIFPISKWHHRPTNSPSKNLGTIVNSLLFLIS